MKKKSSQSALMDSPGRWTGNNIFLKGGLRLTNRIIVISKVIAGQSTLPRLYSFTSRIESEVVG